MIEQNLFLLFTRRLAQIGVRYMISGGAAAMVYGEPRLTNDIDLVVILDRDSIARLPEVFPPSEFYFPSAEAIFTEVAREQRGHFNIIHHATGFKADIYLSGRDPLNHWGLARARAIEFEGVSLMIAPA